MEDKWINELRHVMEDHHADLPEGLWEDIEKEIFPQESQKALYYSTDGKDKTPVIRRFSYLKIAAVLLIFLTIGVFVFFRFYEPENLISYSLTATKKDGPSSGYMTNDKQNSNNPSEKNTASVISDNMNDTVLNTASLPAAAQKIIEELSYTTDRIYPQEVLMKLSFPKLKIPLALQNTFTVQKNTPDIHSEELVLPQQTEPQPLTKKSKNGKWLANILTGNPAASQAQNGTGAYGISEGLTGYPGDSLATALTGNNEARPSIKRKIPLVVGFSIQRSLNPDWSLSAGISYTSQSVQYRYGTESDYTSSENKIQHIVIPIQVNRNIFKKGKFTGYAHGGMNFKIPISDRITADNYSGGLLASTAEERNKNLPVYCSLNAGLGSQLRISQNVGLYAEPAMEYRLGNQYINDPFGNKTKVNLNMRIGVRIFFNQDNK